MTPMRSAIFDLKQSKWQRIYLTFIYLFACYCTYVALHGIWLVLTFFMLILYGVYQTLNQPSLQKLQFLYDRQWRLMMTDGRIDEVVLLGDSVVTRRLSILRFQNKLSKQAVTLILWPDSLSALAFAAVRRAARLGFM